jgi:hypothetical protein
MGYKSRQIGENTLKGPLMLAFKSRQIGESPPLKGPLMLGY